ncbi:MAG: ECF transporter S component [Nitrososphaerota archaeon]|nr:ECF transporter S component [Nitrososphaerota archaeon]
MSSKTNGNNRSKLVASAAICAALYAIVNAATSFMTTPFGLGEFRPGAVIPAFFAITVGPLPAALGAGIGSFLGDMISLVPTGRSTFLWALVAGGTGNFLGFLTLGYVYDKLKNWKGFIVGSTAGLFVGNVVAAAGVVLLGMFFLPASSLNTFHGMAGGPATEIGVGLFLFWFGTMFPFVIILVPPIVRLLRPYASSLSVGREYPDLRETNKRLLWGWSILVALLVLAALAVAIFSGIPGVNLIVNAYGGARTWEILFIIAAAAVLVAGAFLPQLSSARISEEKVSAL